jgi:hypothetical protein
MLRQSECIDIFKLILFQTLLIMVLHAAVPGCVRVKPKPACICVRWLMQPAIQGERCSLGEDSATIISLVASSTAG